MQDTTNAPARPFAPGSRLPGTPYRVLGVLGAANAGSVYEVEHVELGKRFALKALPAEAARFDMVARLRNEWRALARLAHPNIVAVSDAGTTPDGLPFFVMERLDGETLRALLEREERLRAGEAIGIAAAVASALGAAHRIGVVHRDVKPESIFLARGGRVKLLDFGMAKLHSGPSKLTARGVTVGTPRYMAPEQALGERVDHRADFYALGLVLFEMLAGAGPFDEAEDTGAMLLKRATDPAPSLATRAAGLPADLDALAARLLERDPAERPPDARSIADELRQIGSRLLAPVAHDAPTPDAGYAACTRPAMPTEDTAPTTERQAPRGFTSAGATVPDGVAGRASMPPAPAPVDPNATVLAIPLPRRRAVPPPLPPEAQMPVAAEATTLPVPETPAPAVVPARGAADVRSQRAVMQRAALLGAGAAALFLCCLALGWVFAGDGESVPSTAPRSALASDAADMLQPPAHQTAASHPPSRRTPAKSRPVASAKPRSVAPAKHGAAPPKPKQAQLHRDPAPRRTATARPHRHMVLVASPSAEPVAPASTAQRDAAPAFCRPEIPPNPYDNMPPSGL